MIVKLWRTLESIFWINWTIKVKTYMYPGVPKHMKRFESLITFKSTKICCLLFLLINVLYIEII